MQGLPGQGLTHKQQSATARDMEPDAVQTWELTNPAGLCVRIGAIGAALIAVETPARDGHRANIVLGLENADAYRSNPDYVGVVVGRFANRIGGAQFSLDGRTYKLDANDGPNCLHGGHSGWHLRQWHGRLMTLDHVTAVQLSLTSHDNDGGFPGQVAASVTYALTDENRLIIDFLARSDAATPFSPTQHCYWNLAGYPDAEIHDHLLRINAEKWLPVDAALLPDGPPQTVDETALDLRVPRLLGNALNSCAAELKVASGYDHCLILSGSGLREVARLSHPPSGRSMTIHTDRPAIQLYTGQWLGQSGGPHRPFAGVALETQAYPNAPNRSDFPDTILRPHAPFHSRTEFAFSID